MKYAYELCFSFLNVMHPAPLKRLWKSSHRRIDIAFRVEKVAIEVMKNSHGSTIIYNCHNLMFFDRAS